MNHPKHYNARKDGLECIDIIRHYVFDIGCAIKYLWRAGQKAEMGKSDIEKEIEDLEKAVWYINDQLYAGIELEEFSDMNREDAEDLEAMVYHKTGKKVDEIASFEFYEERVAHAMFILLHVGFVNGGYVYRTNYAVGPLRDAVKDIEARINFLKLPMG